MSLLSSDHRCKIFKVIEFRRFVKEKHLKGRSAFSLLKDVESILNEYLEFTKQIKNNVLIGEPEAHSNLDSSAWFFDTVQWVLDGMKISQGMRILSIDDQESIIKISDILRGVVANNLLIEVEAIVELYSKDLRQAMQSIQEE
jgi:hypothetical protein